MNLTAYLSKIECNFGAHSCEAFEAVGWKVFLIGFNLEAHTG